MESIKAFNFKCLKQEDRIMRRAHILAVKEDDLDAYQGYLPEIFEKYLILEPFFDPLQTNQLDFTITTPHLLCNYEVMASWNWSYCIPMIKPTGVSSIKFRILSTNEKCQMSIGITGEDYHLSNNQLLGSLPLDWCL